MTGHQSAIVSLVGRELNTPEDVQRTITARVLETEEVKGQFLNRCERVCLSLTKERIVNSHNEQGRTFMFITRYGESARRTIQKARRTRACLQQISSALRSWSNGSKLTAAAVRLLDFDHSFCKATYMDLTNE